MARHLRFSSDSVVAAPFEGITPEGMREGAAELRRQAQSEISIGATLQVRANRSHSTSRQMYLTHTAQVHANQGHALLAEANELEEQAAEYEAMNSPLRMVS
jgi:hypothetical protein